MRTVFVSDADTDGTVRVVLETAAGVRFETIYLALPEGYGLCLSSQGGCLMGCTFCATARIRPAGNLTAADIIAQVDAARSALALEPSPRYLTFSGMGEPLANYGAVVVACRELRHSLPSTEISISTVGFASRIGRLAAESLDCRLYLSLHAGTESTRTRLIPSSAKTSIPTLLAALEAYGESHGFGMAQVSYLLLLGENDDESELRSLIDHLEGRSLGVQLLMFNQVPGSIFERVPDRVAEHWVESLVDAGIIAYIRSSQGRQIGAGCGQLTARPARVDLGIANPRR